jgi:TfoX/Sxy family transcriptional regulator of competence genes
MPKTPTKKKVKSTPPATHHDMSRFQPVVKAFATDNNVTPCGRFGSVSLKIQDKVFAMLVKGKFVVKLPKDRVAELVATAGAEYFDPGHGRLMKEWVALADQQERWIALAKEARDFVGAAGAPRKQTPKRK